MEKMTITEGLAEIKLIQKKIAKKQQIVRENLTKFEHIDDPFVKDGGIDKVMEAHVQSIKDLHKRLLSIRNAIAVANIKTEVTVDRKTMSIFDWLNWRREVANHQKAFFDSIYTATNDAIKTQAKRPSVYKDEQENTHIVKVEPVLDYAKYLGDSAEIETALEALDGQLSLKNATVLIDIN